MYICIYPPSWTWPTFLERTTEKFFWLAQKRGEPGTDPMYVCKYCGEDWSVIGCEQHVLFQCAAIKSCATTSYTYVGRGTSTNIDLTRAQK